LTLHPTLLPMMVDDLPAAIHGGGLGRGCTVGKGVVGFRHEPTNLAACYMGGTALMLPCSLGSEERANLELEPASSMGTFPLPLTNSMTFRRSEAKQEPIRHVLDTSHYSARSTPVPSSCSHAASGSAGTVRTRGPGTACPVRGAGCRRHGVVGDARLRHLPACGHSIVRWARSSNS
jgi:hypothetical protein